MKDIIILYEEFHSVFLTVQLNSIFFRVFVRDFILKNFYILQFWKIIMLILNSSLTYIVCVLFLSFSVQFSSVTKSCPTLCNPMNCRTPALPVHHHLPEFTQTHVHWVDDAIQPSRPLLSTFPPAPNPSQHQGLFQWVNSSHEVAKVLEFQL